MAQLSAHAEQILTKIYSSYGIGNGNLLYGAGNSVFSPLYMIMNQKFLVNFMRDKSEISGPKVSFV